MNGRRLPACRLVLTPRAAVELMNQTQQLMARMVQAGVLKPASPPKKARTNRLKQILSHSHKHWSKRAIRS